MDRRAHIDSTDQIKGIVYMPRKREKESVDAYTAGLSGGDADVSPQGVDAGTETPGASNPTPDQDLVDEIGKAAGVTYQDNEPLKFGEKTAERDRARWELNPASSEDYGERGTAELDAAESAARRSPKQTRGKRSTH
jgi:hypothetical protein